MIVVVVVMVVVVVIGVLTVLSVPFSHFSAPFPDVKGRIEGLTWMLSTSFGCKWTWKVPGFIPRLPGLSHNQPVKWAKMANWVTSY